MSQRLAATLAVAALGTGYPAAYAQEIPAYPVKAVRVIVPSPPGTPPDLVGRLIGAKLSVALGQPFVLDNRPGATGIIGLDTVAKAPPDGYTLGITAMPFLVVENLVPRMPYDPERDLAPVALIDWNYNILGVAGGSRLQSVADLVAAAKANPGRLRFSSAGNGTPSHLAAELLKKDAGVDLTHIPYKGVPAAIRALLAGEVDITFGAAEAMSPQVKAGKLRALATTAPERLAAYPDLPTFAELGYPGVRLRDWQGLVAPAGTPKAIIARLSGEVAKAVAMPDIRARLEQLGMETASAGPAEFGTLIHAEALRWRKLLHDAGIKAE